MAKKPVATTHVAPLKKEPECDFQQPALASLVSELESLLSQGRLAFLLGAGCSSCAGIPLMDKLTGCVLDDLKDAPKAILTAIRSSFGSTGGSCTIEDFMSELVDHIAIAERRLLRTAERDRVELSGKAYSRDELLDALHQIKLSIAKAIGPQPELRKIEHHRTFVRTLHRTLRSGKGSAPSTGVDYFTLNYDTILEDALAVERIPVADGFRGGATAWWDISHYDESAEARVFKLHGSIDWCMCEGDTLPRRFRDGIEVPSRREHVLIWPAATKYQETQRDPYAQLISRMRHVLRPVGSAETVLCICGYSFGDSHINAEVERALRESNERLTVIAFTSDDEPLGVLKAWACDATLSNRVRIFANRGHFHAEDRFDFPSSIPWWKFEVLCELLAGRR